MLLKNITRLCKERGISIARLERESGIGNGTIGRWGRTSPNLENVLKVAEYFGVTLESLLSAEDD